MPRQDSLNIEGAGPKQPTSTPTVDGYVQLDRLSYFTRSKTNDGAPRHIIYEHVCPGMNLLNIDHIMVHTMVSFPAGYILHTPLCRPDTVAISPKPVHTSTTLEGRARGLPSPTLGMF